MTPTHRRTFKALVLAPLLGLAMLAAAQDQPPTTEATPEAGQAMVRFLNAAPNAEVAGIALSDGEEQALVEQFANVGHGEISDYVPVNEGGYEVRVDLASVAGEPTDDAVEVPADNLDTFAGEYYTIALLGLVQPDEDAGEGGFVEWLQGLFTDQDDAYTLRAMVIDDVAPFALAEGEAEIRVAHLAAGTEAVDLVQVNAEDDVNTIHSVGYGEVSGFGQLNPSEGQLELRVGGSEATLLDLADLQLEPGSSQTVYIVGTPVEEVPLQTIVVENRVASTATTAPGAPGAPAAGTPVAPGAPVASTDMTFYRETLAEIEARLGEIQGHLEQMQQVDEVEGEATTALERVQEAILFVQDAYNQLEAQPAAVPAVPAEPADQDDDGK